MDSLLNIGTLFAFLNPMKNWREILKARNLFQNYFWVFTIGTITQILTGKGYVISLLFPCVIYYLAVKTNGGSKQINVFDLLWWIFLLLNVQTWVFNSYPYKMQLIGRFFMVQGAYMVAYWVGRKSNVNNLDKIFSKAVIPLIVTCLFGLYLYLFRPSWYMSMLYAQYMDAGQQAFQEFSRLRSIFASPYVLAYFSSMTMSWMWFKLFNLKRITYMVYVFIGLLFCTSILCMMRVPWVCAMLSLGIAIVHLFFYGKNKFVLRRILPFILILFIIISYALVQMDSEDYLFLMDKIGTVSSNQSDLISDRVNLYKINQTWFGEGAGRHAFYADEYPPNYQLPDGEYQKMQAEIGNIGMFSLCLLFGFGLLKAIKHFKYLYFELCIIIMCLITMMGASSLMVVNEHPFIFWLALGQVSGFHQKNKYKNDKSKIICNVSSSISLYS